MFVDLSHTIYDGMPGFRLKNEDGTFTAYTASVKPFLTHAESAPKYDNQACFEITEVSFQTSVGTYIDSPYHRFVDKKDVSEIEIQEVVTDGVIIDATGLGPGESLSAEHVPHGLGGKAALFRFGWDHLFGSEAYHAYPFLHPDAIDRLVAQKPRLVGVDTINIDDHRDPARPAHTHLLDAGIYVVENLRGLHELEGKSFRFFAVPLRVKGAAAMPIRAFAEV